MSTNRCEICGMTPAPQLPPLAGFELQSSGRGCPRCGNFYLMGTAVNRLSELLRARKLEGSVVSHRIRRRFDAVGKPIVLYEADLETYAGDVEPPNPEEQLENLVLWIGRTQRLPEEWAQATPARLAAIIGAAKTESRSDEPGLDWLLQQVKDRELFVTTSSSNGSELKLRLTMSGWREFGILRRRVAISKNAFMAMKFGDASLDKVLAECFKPAVARAGFSLRPLNDGQEAGLIDNQIRTAIRSARFVVADLTHDNNGAYFEAGFAEGLGLPVIYTCEASKFSKSKTHFDTNHLVTIPWDLGNLDAAARELTATVRNTLPGEAIFED